MSETVVATPAAKPGALRRRRQPGAVRLARMTAGAALQRGPTWWGRLRGDPLCEIFTSDRQAPWDAYERLRSRGPVSRSTIGLYATADHAAASAVLASRAFGPGSPDSDVLPFEGDIDVSLLVLNPPDHTRLRRLVAPAFGRRRLDASAPRIEAGVERLLDDVPADGPWDVMERLAAPLPITVITQLLDIPDYDEPAFRRAGDAMAGSLDGVRSPRHGVELLRAERELRDVFERLFALRAARPGDDVVSRLVQAREQNRIAPEDMVPLCTLLLLAGFETTVNLIGSAVPLLLHDPDAWARVAHEPGAAEAAVEETLRFAPPVHLTFRFALEDVEVGGHAFRRGDAIVPVLAAANRDPAVFDRPDVFDPERADASDHLSFSAGAHYCLGAPLARLEAAIALRSLARRFPDLVLAGPVVPRRGVTLRGPRRLPVHARRRA